MTDQPQSAGPLVSIVTPCLNSERFIEETVESVLSQDYPNIEYVVMDGGSSDATLSVLERYKERISVCSEPDNGPADAVNKGLRRTSGEIVAFLNADDCYLPGAVSAAVRGMLKRPGVAAVYGEGVWVDEDGQEVGPYPVAEFDAQRFSQQCYICQPAVFMRREDIETIGLLDSTLKYTFDYDLWIRLARHFKMSKIPQRLASSRMHQENISLGSRRAVFGETVQLLKRHYEYVPFGWVHSYVSFQMDRRDQFFEPLKPSFTKYILSLPIGLYHNNSHPLRYLKEWCNVMSMSGLKRQLISAWPGKIF